MELPQTSIKNLSNDLDLDEITWGLINILPLDINSMILTGGILFDAIWYKNFNSNTAKYNNNQFKDIDLFLFGSEEKKKYNIIKVIDNIINKYGIDNVWAGYLDTIINITIVGIPRCVQIICTNKNTADEIINDFDLAHVMMYLSNAGLYVSPFALVSMELKHILPNPRSRAIAKFSRLKKYHERGLSMSKYISEYPMISLDFKKICDNEKIVQIYSKSNNFKKNINSYYANFNKLFNRNNINIKKYKLTKKLNLYDINITGNCVKYNDEYGDDHRDYGDYSYYSNDPELFLFEKMELDNARELNNYSFNFKKLVRKDYNDISKSNGYIKNKIWSHLFEATIIHYQYNKNYTKNHARCNYFDSPHLMIISVEDPQVISTIKANIKILLKDIKQNQELATTCLLDSQAINPDEKDLFGFGRPEEYNNFVYLKQFGICNEEKDNFKNSKALYLTICPEEYEIDEYINRCIIEYEDDDAADAADAADDADDAIRINSKSMNKLSAKELKPGKKIFLSCKYISVQPSINLLKFKNDCESYTPYVKICGFIV